LSWDCQLPAYNSEVRGEAPVPQAPLSDSEKRKVIAALKQAKGNRTFAASLMGLGRATFFSRVCSMKQDPKWAKLIPEPPSTATLTGVASPDAAAKSSAKRIQFLEAKIDRMQAARVKAVRPAKKRSGRDDEIVVAMPDVHGSQQDPAAVAAFLGDLKRLRPSRVIGLGDVIDCGGFLAQHHVLGFVAEAEYTWEQDVAAANALLDSVQTAAGSAQVELLAGNHDERPERWAVTAALRNKVDAEFLRKQVATDIVLGLKKRGINYYRRSEFYDGLSIQGTIKRGKVLFTHGLQRGAGSGVTACARMLDRYGTNVCWGHTHWLAQLVKRDVYRGTIGAWNSGCLSKLAPLWMGADPTNWNHGFTVFVVARSGNFLAIPVPIVNGVSLLPELKL